jgi:hypothetical protein
MSCANTLDRTQANQIIDPAGRTSLVVDARCIDHSHQVSLPTHDVV